MLCGTSAFSVLRTLVLASRKAGWCSNPPSMAGENAQKELAFKPVIGHGVLSLLRSNSWFMPRADMFSRSKKDLSVIREESQEHSETSLYPFRAFQNHVITVDA